MFRKQIALSLAVISGSALLWTMLCLVVSEKDRTFYKSLLEQKHAISSSSTLANSYQKRQGVRKDIWSVTPEGRRLHHRLESVSSLLTLIPKGNKIDIIENLGELKCWMQDKVFMEGSPMQQVRYFEAREGAYRLLAEDFSAHNVSLAVHRLPGENLPAPGKLNTPFLKGVAEDVFFSLSEKTPQFKAHHFVATFKHRENS